jgi:hypothetical protein
MKNGEMHALEIARSVESPEDIAALFQHVKEVVDGTAFRGSQRSGQFLTYIVEQWAAGRFESLKERIIGAELFGRPHSYDTGEDAIVRVTASEVRKRLRQHYEKSDGTSRFRIGLPLGSDIPEIIHDSPEGSPRDSPANSPAPLSTITPAPMVASTSELPSRGTSFPRIYYYVAAVMAVLIAAVFLLWIRSARSQSSTAAILPWSQIFNSPRGVQLITSDAELTEIETLTGKPVTLSDYANQKYLPDASKLSPDAQRLFHSIERGGQTSGVDTPAAVEIAELAPPGGGGIVVRGARSVQLADLQTASNLIVLGSPASNPWAALFNDELDFRFFFDDPTGQEIIQNAHPRAGERAVYIPTARGWATGLSFATISLVQNPDQNSQALLLAGANAEGTEAAGKLVTDLPRLSATLTKCGITPSGPLRHFQILLRVNTMAGSPTEVAVVSCHILPGQLQP